MYLLSYLKYSKYLFYPNYKKVDPKQRLLLAICLGSFLFVDEVVYSSVFAIITMILQVQKISDVTAL